MSDTKMISENLDELNKLILDLKNIGIEIEDEDKTIIILNSLPSSLSLFVDAMKYAKDNLVFEEIQKALKAKESEKHKEWKQKIEETVYI